MVERSEPIGEMDAEIITFAKHFFACNSRFCPLLLNELVVVPKIRSNSAVGTFFLRQQ